MICCSKAQIRSLPAPEMPVSAMSESELLGPEIPIDCLLITRPRAQAEDLAERLSDLDWNIVIQPAHEFAAVTLSGTVLNAFQQALSERLSAVTAPLLIFTSTRAVHFALQQLTREQLTACQLAAIGPATAVALQRAGFDAVIQPNDGYTSEDLLRKFDQASFQPRQAWVVAAEGGREALLRGLQERGVVAGRMLVYERRPAPIAKATVRQLEQSSQVLSVWTSADAIQQLANGLSATAWQRVRAGQWLVISQRLADIAADRGACASVSAGPGNVDLAFSIRQLCLQE